MMRAAVVMLLMIGAAVMLLRDAQAELSRPLGIAQGTLVQVPRGASLGALLQDWQRAGWISARQRAYLSLHARATGAALRLKAGEYEFGPQLGARDLVALVVSGRAVQHELRIIEGWRFEDAVAALRRHAAVQQTLPQADAAALMSAIGQAGVHPEGRFYPDTYRFTRGTTDVALLRHAFEAMAARLAEDWESREEGLPYLTPDQALVMASIVERETGAPAERREIAGVFIRRLRMGMRLQTDPTVIYGLGNAFDGNLRKRDLLADTPYNTYTRAGLPPTPICLPGRAALRAAMHPAPGETLYFVARGDGTHQFSETMTQHTAAVREFQLKRRRR
ncbi:MAG TPA: endolytic transglycosylase MltG [Verrucomicrobiae bacterium]|nr:endolytic transglycosylase MltG [Verrucomicrobiae bacterium]